MGCAKLRVCEYRTSAEATAYSFFPSRNSPPNRKKCVLLWEYLGKQSLCYVSSALKGKNGNRHTGLCRGVRTWAGRLEMDGSGLYYCAHLSRTPFLGSACLCKRYFSDSHSIVVIITIFHYYRWLLGEELDIGNHQHNPTPHLFSDMF